MKEFKVPIKNELRDFTATRDFWVSLGDHIECFDYASVCKKSEAVISLFAPLPESGLHTAESLPDTFASERKSFPGDLFYFNSEKGDMFASVNSNYQWVLFKRDLKKHIVLPKGYSEQEIDLSDFVVCFKDAIAADPLEKLARDLYGSPHISYSLINDIRTLLEAKKLKTTTLTVFDYSPKESYQFSIKSSLNSVSLTIDMIKNKVLKYHYDKIWKIETVLHETLVNAITYGNELDYDRPVHIEYEVGDKGFRILIRDSGTGFDVSGFSVPVGIEALDQISGRGIYIMKKFSEALFFNDKGNQAMLYFEF